MVRAPGGHQNRDGVIARQHLPGRGRAGRPEGRDGVLPVQPGHIEIRYQDKSYGKALPHNITRHAHPKARPETPDPAPAPATGIDYLAMVADTHHQRVAADETINFDALYPQPDWHHNDRHRPGDQFPGRLSIEGIRTGTVDPTDTGEATG